MTVLEMIEAAVASVKAEIAASDSDDVNSLSNDEADIAEIVPASVRYSVHAPC